MAIGYGADLIGRGRLEAALCGGADALCRTALAGFNALRVVDTEPCRPFDVSRNGMNIGEAGAVLVLEDMARAGRRGAHVYVELAGYAASCEAYHATAPEPDGVAVAALLHGGARGLGRAAPRRWTTSTPTGRARRRTTGPRRGASAACSAIALPRSRSPRSSRWSGIAWERPARSRRRRSRSRSIAA